MKQLIADLKKWREDVWHERKGDCNSLCYAGCEACLLDRAIGVLEKQLEKA